MHSDVPLSNLRIHFAFANQISLVPSQPDHDISAALALELLPDGIDTAEDSEQRAPAGTSIQVLAPENDSCDAHLTTEASSRTNMVGDVEYNERRSRASVVPTTHLGTVIYGRKPTLEPDCGIVLVLESMNTHVVSLDYLQCPRFQT